MAAQGVEKLALGGIIQQHPIFDGNHQVGAVRAEAHVVDGIALGLVISLWYLPMMQVACCVCLYVFWSPGYSGHQSLLLRCTRVHQPESHFNRGYFFGTRAYEYK